MKKNEKYLVIEEKLKIEEWKDMREKEKKEERKEEVEKLRRDMEINIKDV